jgi:hypothetical protein
MADLLYLFLERSIHLAFGLSLHELVRLDEHMTIISQALQERRSVRAYGPSLFQFIFVNAKVSSQMSKKSPRPKCRVINSGDGMPLPSL